MNKTDRAFFRGRDSREERLHLVSLSKKNPELLDAGITGWFFFRDREKHIGKVPLVGLFEFFKVRENEWINYYFKFQKNSLKSLPLYILTFLCFDVINVEIIIFPLLVQVPGERGWNSRSISLSLPDAREQSGSEARLPVLWIFLQPS